MSPLLSPDDPRAPKYWRYEQGGELVPAVERFLGIRHEPLTPRDRDLIRTYLRQWIDSPVWEMNPSADAYQLAELAGLRVQAAQIHSVGDIRRWINRAMNSAIDPF